MLWRHNLAKILIAGLIFSLLFNGVSSPLVSAQNGWVIDGDKVYIDDANVYLSATPHTLTNSGWIEFELMSKNYEGNIDIAWGFVSDDDIQIRQPQIWADNVAHNVSEWGEFQTPGEIIIGNITAYQPLQWNGIEPDIGSHNNSHLVELTINDIETLIVAYNSYEQIDSTTAKFYYNFTEVGWVYHTEYYPDYKPIPGNHFTQEFYEYAGVDRWYYISFNTPIEKDVIYKARCFVDIPIVLGDFASKYAWAVKPSGETIYEARQSGHLYVLDPWLAGGWDQRVKLTADHNDIDSDLSDFPFLIYISTSSGRNNEDVSFVFDELQSDNNRKKIAVTTSNGTGQCYVEIELWDDGNEKAWLHVKAPSVNSTVDEDFYLYYDADASNNTAYVDDQNVGNSHNVWNSTFQAVYHMNSASDAQLIDSTNNNEDSNNNTLDAQISGMIGSAMNDDRTEYATENDLLDTVPTTFTWEAWVKSNDQSAAQYIMSKINIAAQDRALFYVDTNGHLCFDTEENNNGLQTLADDVDMVDNAWHHVGVVWDNSAGKLIYLDGGLATSDGAETTLMNNGNSADFCIDTYNIAPTAPWIGDTDEVRVSYTTRIAAWFKASYESGRDDLLDWGSEESAATPPTVDTLAATGVGNTSATLNGNVTALGDTSIKTRGFVWDTSSHAKPDENTAPNATAYAYYWVESGNWSTGTFSHVASLSTATTYYYRAAANNTNNKWDYGDELTFLTKPAPPTNVAASDGTSAFNVTITWTLSTGNVTGYYILYGGGTLLATVGNVSAHNDTSAPAPTITPGTASATDGTSSTEVTLSLAGESANNGTSRTYYLISYNGAGNSSNSGSDSGYRGVGSLTYQWMRSNADADAGYANIGGATTDPYSDTAAPAPSITANNATASDGTSASYVTLSANETVSDGAGRWYLCALTATGSAAQNSTHNRGYRGTTTRTFQWWRSWADVAANYSQIAGGTTDPFNDVNGAVSPDGRYYLCTINMTGAVSQNTSADRGYKAPLSAPNMTCSMATSITITSAVLHGNVTDTGGANVTMRGFEWGYATGNYTFSWNETAINFGIGAYNHSIGSLNMCDQVFWRSWAVNSQGTGNSTECTFNTTCGTAPTVTCGTATSVTTTSGVLHGTVTDAGYLNITMRGFEWGYGTGNYTFSWNETSADFGTGAFSHSIGGLTNCTTIYFIAFAVNSQGRGNSTECNFATSCAGGITLDLSDLTNVFIFGFFVCLALALLAMFLWKRLGLLSYGSAGAWAVAAFQCLGISASTSPIDISDVWMALFWLFVGFTIGMALLPTVMRPKTEPEDLTVDQLDEMQDIDGSDLSEFVPKKKPEPLEKKKKRSPFAEAGQL